MKHRSTKLKMKNKQENECNVTLKFHDYKIWYQMRNCSYDIEKR